jgi:hypothetical protein
MSDNLKFVSDLIKASPSAKVSMFKKQLEGMKEEVFKRAVEKSRQETSVEKPSILAGQKVTYSGPKYPNTVLEQGEAEPLVRYTPPSEEEQIKIQLKPVSFLRPAKKNFFHHLADVAGEVVVGKKIFQEQEPTTTEEFLKSPRTEINEKKAEQILTYGKSGEYAGPIAGEFEIRKSTDFENRVAKENFERSHDWVALVSFGGGKGLKQIEKNLPKLEKALKEMPEFMSKQVEEAKDLSESMKKLSKFAKMETESTLNLERMALEKAPGATMVKEIPTFKAKTTFKELERRAAQINLKREDIIEAADSVMKDPLLAKQSPLFEAATRMFYQKEALAYDRLAVEAAKNPSNIKLAEKAKESFSKLWELGVAMDNVSSVSGRSLGLRRWIPKVDTILRKSITKILKNLSPEEVAKVNALVKDSMGNPVKLKDILLKYSKGTWADKLKYLVVNNYLSAVTTFETNIIGNITNVSLKGLRIPFEAMGDVLRTKVLEKGTQREVFAGEILPYFKTLPKGIKTGFREALNEAKAIYSGEKEVTNLFGEQMYKLPPIRGTLGKIIGTPTNALKITDNLFKESLLTMEEARNVYRVSKGGRALEKAETMEDVKNALLQSNLQGWEAHFAKAIEESLIPKILTPFVKIGINIFKEGARHTPILSQVLLYGKKGRQFTSDFGKSMLGTTLFLPALLLAMREDEEGRPMLTGAAPMDVAERDMFYSQQQPDSILINGKYYPYKSYEPLHTVLRVAAAMGDEYRKKGKMNLDMLTKGSKQVVLAMKDKTFLKALGDTYDKVFLQDEETSGEKAMAFVKERLINMAIPNLVQSQARGLDDFYRDPETFKEYIYSKIPVASEEVRVKLDALGLPIERAGGYIKRALTPMLPVEAGNIDVIRNEFKQIDKVIPFITKTLHGIKLNKEEYAKLNIIRGDLIRPQLLQIIQTSEYQHLNDNDKGEVLDKVVSDANKVAQTLYIKFNGETFYKTITSSEKNLVNYWLEYYKKTEEGSQMTDQQIKKMLEKNVDTLKTLPPY